MKIAHISDLHFCVKELEAKLKAFQHELKASTFSKVLPIDFAFDFADPPTLVALQQWLTKEDPDVIVVSGDITTFGDNKSFEFAHEWLQRQKHRRGGIERPIIVVPGNHDVLHYQFTELRRKLDDLAWLPRTAIQWTGSDVFKRLDDCLKSAGAAGNEALDNFRRFLDGGFIGTHFLAYDLDNRSSVVFHPFCSVSTDPIWMNSGRVRQLDWNRVRSGIESMGDKGGKLHVAVIHHNPLSSPDVVESPVVYGFNGMPGGTDYLKTMQSMGVDLVMHGHQHMPLVVQFDFDLKDAGHAYCLGVPSAATKGKERAGCRLLEIQHVNEVKLKTFDYDSKGYFVEGHSQVLPLERHRPMDAKTAAARYELKRYVYFAADPEETHKESKSLWDDAMASGAKLIYMSGRKASSIARGRGDDIRRLLDEDRRNPCRIRILLTDPDLLDVLTRPSTASEEETERVKRLWGPEEDLGKLAKEARESLQELEKLVNGLRQDLRKNIDVRTAHTVLPFAATVRDPHEPWAKMVLRILPVGAIGELAAPVLKLNRRESAALFDYYNDHLRRLLSLGAHKFGDWAEGDDRDLHIEGLSP